MALKVLNRSGRDLIGVEFKARRRIQKDGGTGPAILDITARCVLPIEDDISREPTRVTVPGQ